MIETAATEEAILRTVLYADVFDYPLTVDEIHRYLVGTSASHVDVQTILRESVWLSRRLSNRNGLYSAAGRENTADLRLHRELSAARLWRLARWYGWLAARLPYVRMVAVTGALAVNNVANDDDIDLLIVTTPGRVWLTRALVVALVKFAGRMGARLCPNYVLAASALQQARRDLFMAHELAQMIPLAGHELYWQMRWANGWSWAFLPNAGNMPRHERDVAPKSFDRWLQSLAEKLLSGKVGDTLEVWEQNRKLKKFKHQLGQAGSAALLDSEHVKGHFNDYGVRTLLEYERRCERVLDDDARPVLHQRPVISA